MQFRFDNRVVIVTGAAQNIGAEIAKAFGRAGALVCIADIDADGLVARGKALGVEHYALDLSHRSQTRKTVDVIAKRHGGFVRQT